MDATCIENVMIFDNKRQLATAPNKQLFVIIG